MKKPIDLYIDNLKRLAGVKSDSELARNLSLSKQAIASWRRRDSVPLVQQKILTALYGPEAAFDEHIGYVATFRERVTIISAFLRLFDKYRNELNPDTEKDAYEHCAEILLNYEDDMEQFIRSTGWITTKDGKAHEFTTDEVAKLLVALADAITPSFGYTLLVTRESGSQ